MMRKFSGRLREVVAYMNQITGGLFQEEVRTHLFYGREFFASKQLRYAILCSH